MFVVNIGDSLIKMADSERASYLSMPHHRYFEDPKQQIQDFASQYPETIYSFGKDGARIGPKAMMDDAAMEAYEEHILALEKSDPRAKMVTSGIMFRQGQQAKLEAPLYVDVTEIRYVDNGRRTTVFLG